MLVNCFDVVVCGLYSDCFGLTDLMYDHNVAKEQEQEQDSSLSSDSAANDQPNTKKQDKKQDKDKQAVKEKNPEKNEDSKKGVHHDVIDNLIDDNYRWYIVNVYAGNEDSVKVNLWDRVKRAKHEEYFKNIIVPKIIVEKILAKGGRKKVEKTSFPGYMFVQMIINDDTLSTVVGTPRIQGFLGNHRHPKPMTDKDVLHFLGGKPDDQEQVEEVVDGPDLFTKDQAIRVIDGPFANFDGVVDEVKPDQMKLKVLVSILGRETPVELSYDQVEKVKE